MNVMLQLLLVALVLRHPGDVDGQFGVAPPTCPSDTITFRCTVAGDSNGVTIWRVGGSSARCVLLHGDQSDTSTCGPGGVFTARFYNITPTSFSSTLSVTASAPLDGTLVECFGPASTLNAANMVGSGILQIVDRPSLPSLSCVDLSNDTNGTVSVTVSWTLSGGDSADFYLINITTNDPQPPYGGLLNISNASVTQRELTGFRTGYEYTITVRGVNCGNQEGNDSETLTITPQVPMAPVPNVRAEYHGTVGTLQTITITWNEVDPVNVSVDCIGGQDIGANYEVIYTSSSGTSIATCVVNVIDCNNGVCRHEIQNNITDSRCQPPEPQFNSESVTVTVTSRNVVGRSNPATLMTPVPRVCAEYDRTGILQIIESTWNEVDVGAIYELSYTSSSGTNMITCRIYCSDGVCRHELQNNTTDSECNPPLLQFNGENVTLTMSTRNIDYSVSRNISSTSTLRVDVDSTNTANAFVKCTFEPGYNCTIDYGIDPSDPSYTNLVYNDNSSTNGEVANITLSQNLETNTLYSYNVSAVSISQCARVRGTFRTECTVSDLRTESDLRSIAQGGVRDPRCDARFRRSLPICNGVVCYDGTTAMSEAVYICDDTFSLMGETPRQCGNDGNWSPPRIPQCISPEPPAARTLTILGSISVSIASLLIIIVAMVFLIITVIVSCCKKEKAVKVDWWVLLSISLMTVTALFSAIGVALWIAVGVVASNPPICLSELLLWRDRRDPLVISGFVISILALIYAIAAMIWFVYMKHEKQPSGKCATSCMVVMIVLLCLSVIGIPFVPIVLYFRKVDKDAEVSSTSHAPANESSVLSHGGATCCIVVMIILLCLSVVGILFAFIVYYMYKKQGDPEDTDGSRKEHELQDISTRKEEEAYSTLQHGKPPISPDPLLSDKTYSALGEHGEAAGDLYSQTRHGVMPHAVPNPEDPTYSHFNEGGGDGGGEGGGQEYSHVQRGKPPKPVPNPSDPNYSRLNQGTQGTSRPPAEDLQYDVVGTEPRYTPSQKGKEEGKGKRKRQK